MGLQHVTRIGWLSLGLGIAACAVSLIRTYTSEQNKHRQEQQVNSVRQLAYNEIARGIGVLTGSLDPTDTLFDDVFKSLSEPKVIDSLAATDLMSETWVHEPIMEVVENWKHLSRSAERCQSILTDALTTYSGYLDAESISQVNGITHDQFFVSRWLRIQSEVSRYSYPSAFKARPQLLLGAVWFTHIEVEVGGQIINPIESGEEQLGRNRYLTFLDKLRTATNHIGRRAALTH